MSRRGLNIKKRIETDPVFGSRLISKLINRAMRDGKKEASSKQVYHALAILKEKTEQEPMSVFSQALENIKPQMEVRPRRIGGAAYQIPTQVRGSRKESLAIRWLIQAARDRSSREYHTFAEKLAAEILDATNNAGAAVKKRENVHKMAEANKAFAHFRW